MSLITFFLIATVLLVTWPLPLHFTDAFPIGTEQESTVPLFNAWSLWWVADRAGNGFEHFWQAPIFFPSEGAFTFSEPQPLTGLLVLPFWKLFASPATIYNLALCLCLLLNGIFAYRVGRALQLPLFPSLIGSALMVSLPISQKFLGVLPLLPIFGLLWTLEGVIRFGREGSWRMAVWTGMGLLIQMCTSQQLALMFSLIAIPAVFLALAHQRFTFQAVIKLGTVALGVLLLVGWYAWYPLHLHQTLGLSRPETLVKTLSATPSDYLSKPSSATFTFPEKEDLHSDTGGLFPGLVLALLACLGIVSNEGNTKIRQWAWYVTGMAVGGFLLSLGTNSPFDGGGLLLSLREWIPGFQAFRSPFRFAILVQVGFGLLATMGLHRLRLHFPSKLGVLILCVAGMFALGENLSWPQPIRSLSPSWPAPWMVWLADQKDRHVIGHVPFPEGLHVSDYQMESERMLAQIVHHKVLINGYSGFFPPGYDQFQLDMAKNFPSSFLTCFLSHELNVDTLVINATWYQTHEKTVSHFPELSQPVFQDEEVVIVALSGASTACRENLRNTPLGLWKPSHSD